MFQTVSPRTLSPFLPGRASSAVLHRWPVRQDRGAPGGEWPGGCAAPAGDADTQTGAPAPWARVRDPVTLWELSGTLKGISPPSFPFGERSQLQAPLTPGRLVKPLPRRPPGPAPAWRRSGARCPSFLPAALTCSSSGPPPPRRCSHRWPWGRAAPPADGPRRCASSRTGFVLTSSRLIFSVTERSGGVPNPSTTVDGSTSLKKKLLEAL